MMSPHKRTSGRESGAAERELETRMLADISVLKEFLGDNAPLNRHYGQRVVPSIPRPMSIAFQVSAYYASITGKRA